MCKEIWLDIKHAKKKDILVLTYFVSQRKQCRLLFKQKEKFRTQVSREENFPVRNDNDLFLMMEFHIKWLK